MLRLLPDRSLAHQLVATVLVVFMVGVAAAGTYLQILTSVNMDWDCATVGE